MPSKFQLTISPDYVGEWTHVEAARELFQNALDNETLNPDNRMFFSYQDGLLRLGNKSSVLTAESLLLGHSTKRGQSNTIGKHGEGYKIALMVLLRDGKTVTIFNYGAREIWKTRLIKSRKFNGASLVEVTITKKAIFSSVPDHDLVIQVEGITHKEYEDIVNSNLHLQDNVSRVSAANLGEVLLNPEHKGKIFVNGLFIAFNDKFHYGYNVRPSLISLDRDRKLLDSFALAYATSKIWRVVDQEDLLADLVFADALDVKYLSESRTYMARDVEDEERLSALMYRKFVSEHGPNAVPVSDNAGLQRYAALNSSLKPIFVSETTTKLISRLFKSPEVERVSPKQRLKVWFNEVSEQLSQEQIDQFEDIFDSLSDY